MGNQQPVVENEVFPQQLRRSHLTRNILLLLSVFIVLSVIYYYIFRTIPRQSDLAGTFLAGHDMSKGNWRLKGWWLGADNFVTTDIIFYALLVKCVGPNPEIMFYLPAMLWAAVVLLSLILARAGTSRGDRWLATAAVATPILLPIIRDHAGVAQISESPMHIGTVGYILLSFLFVKKVLAGHTLRPTLVFAAYSFFLILAVFGDPVAIFMGALPIIAVTGFSVFQDRRRLLHCIVLFVTVLAVVLGRLLVRLFARFGGFETCTPINLHVVTFDQLGNTIALAIHYLFALFGCDFFGKELSGSLLTGPVVALIRLPFLILLILALASLAQRILAAMNTSIARWPITEGDYLDAILAMAFAINVLLAILSPQLLDSATMTVRYLFPALIFGVILIARTVKWSRFIGTFCCVALTASLVFTALAYAQLPKGTDPQIETLSNWLTQHNLTNGFGPYWSSSIVTALTENRVKIRALVSDGQGKIKPFEWVAKKAWYQPKLPSGTRVFVLACDVPQPPDFYEEPDVIRTLGEPKEKYHFASFIINVYEGSDEKLRSILLP